MTASRPRPRVHGIPCGSVRDVKTFPPLVISTASRPAGRAGSRHRPHVGDAFGGVGDTRVRLFGAADDLGSRGQPALKTPPDPLSSSHVCCDAKREKIEVGGRAARPGDGGFLLGSGWPSGGSFCEQRHRLSGSCHAGLNASACRSCRSSSDRPPVTTAARRPVGCAFAGVVIIVAASS